MNFVELGKSDLKFITQLQHGNFKDGWTEKMIEAGFDCQRLLCFAGYENQNAVSLIFLSVIGDEADVEGVMTVKEYRNKGYGKKTVEHALNVLTSMGVKKVFLEVRQSNICAIKLYEKCGFLPLSVRKKYYSDGEDAVVMVKESL